jgi:hypothetical protein
MKTFKYPLFGALLAIGLLFTQCSKDDDTPEPVNEEEVINRVTFDVTADGSTTTYTWEEGATSFSLPLKANKAYEVAVSFFNATDPADVEAINPEVIEEADEHQVFYENSSSVVAIASVSSDNKDSAGNPLGLKTAWTTTAAGEAVVRLYLIHEPSTKSGASRADFGGETDVQIDINVAVTE